MMLSFLLMVATIMVIWQSLGIGEDADDDQSAVGRVYSSQWVSTAMLIAKFTAVFTWRLLIRWLGNVTIPVVSISLILLLGSVLLLKVRDRRCEQQEELKLPGYELGRKLGEGGFGFVVEAINISTGQRVAVKVIEKQGISSTRKILMEARLHCRLRHEGIVRCFRHHEDVFFVYIVLELVRGGDLWGLLVREGCLGERRAACLISEVTKALHYCHSNGIIHRDLKPENILLGEDGTAKLADFGLSVRHRRGGHTAICGTAGYMSPEMLQGPFYDERTDIYSLGVLVYELIRGCAPVIMGNRVIFFNSAYISGDARDLIEKLLCTNPTHRIKLSEVLNHPWVTTHCHT